MMHPIEGLADDTIEGLSDAVKNNPEIGVYYSRLGSTQFAGTSRVC